MRRRSLATQAAIALAVLCSVKTTDLTAHGPIARETDLEAFQARLFAADAASGDVIALDLPDGKLVGRIPTPPFIMSLGLSQNQQYVFAMRGRSTDRDFVTIIDTGIDASQKRARPPFVSRTLVADTPGGVRGGRVASVGGRDAIFNEGRAELLIFNSDDYSGISGLEPSTYQLANPDHYHYLETDEHLYVAHLRTGMIQILERESGDEVKRIPNCGVAHGMAKDVKTGRLLYGCSDGVVVIGTRGDETNRELGRIAYPGDLRVAAFQEAGDRVQWAYTEGTLPALYRLDLKQEPWTFDVLNVPRSIQQRVSDDGRYLLVFARSGELYVHDGESGELLRTVPISGPLEDDLHEHVDKAILPGIETLDGTAYVSLPHEGRIVAVNLEQGRLVKTMNTGGEPTRMVIATGGAGTDGKMLADLNTDGRWYDGNLLARGADVYALNCAVCHGDKAQGNWGAPYEAGSARSVPPPLNGSGKTADSSYAGMIAVLEAGAEPYMPGFGNMLSNSDELAVVAYYQGFWPDEVYATWVKRHGEPTADTTTHEHSGQNSKPHRHGDGKTHSH